MNNGLRASKIQVTILLFLVLALFLFSSLILYELKNRFSFSNASYIFLNSILELLLFGGSYFLVFKKHSETGFNFAPKSIFFVLPVFFFNFFFWTLYQKLATNLGFKPGFYQKELFTGVDMPLEQLLVLIGAGVIGPLSEELYFRGSLFGIIKKSRGVLPAALFSSAVFGFLHGGFYFIPLFVFGMLLSYLVIIDNSLDAAILVHMLNNIAAVIFYLYF